MGLLKKLLLRKNNKDTKSSKKDVSIRNHSTLFFQLGLIVSMFVIMMIINGNYQVLEHKDVSLPYDSEEPFYINEFEIIVPTPPEEVKVEKKEVAKKIITDVIDLVDNNDTQETDETVDTDPPVIDMPDDTKPTIKTPPEPVVDPKPVSVMGVERVPIFPGCEYLTDNTERRDCMSAHIGRLVSDRFNKKLASDLGLRGEQRIYVTFSINKNGEVSNIQARAPHPRLQNEAKRVVRLIPKMIPGMQSNQTVEVLYNLPIIFHVVN